jgi:hypothetical protein
MDNGKPFMKLFKELCTNMKMKPKNTTSYNPQGNSIVERVHQVLGNHMRTFEMDKRQLDGLYPFDEFLSAAAYAVRCTYHTTLRATPGQLVFGRDMHLPTKFVADWAAIAMQKQKEIERNNARENKKRVEWDYRSGQQVLLERPGLIGKLESPRSGPYTITQVHVNGTVTIQRGPTTERVNIRRVTPYFPSSA